MYGWTILTKWLTGCILWRGLTWFMKLLFCFAWDSTFEIFIKILNGFYDVICD